MPKMRFSLRTVFLCFTFVAISFGWLQDHQRLKQEKWELQYRFEMLKQNIKAEEIPLHLVGLEE